MCAATSNAQTETHRCKDHRRSYHQLDKIISSNTKIAKNLYRQEFSNISSQEHNIGFQVMVTSSQPSTSLYFHIKTLMTTHLVLINEAIQATTTYV
jgi:hypothetical protein